MTREEYISNTGLKSPAEAFSLLWELRLGLAFLLIAQGYFFVALLTHWPRVPMVIVTGLILVIAACVTYVGVTILHAVREPIWKMALNLLFPFYWFWTYPQMARPLKIACGRRAAPERLPRNFAAYRQTPLNVALDFKMNRLIATAAIFGIVLLVGFWKDGKNSQIETSLQSTTVMSLYTSTADGFQAQFPQTPGYTDSTKNSSTPTHRYMATDSSGNGYAIFVFGLQQQNGQTTDPDPILYQDFLAKTLGTKAGGSLSGAIEKLNGETAYHFVYTQNDGTLLQGDLVKHGTHLYLLTVGGTKQTGDQKTLEEAFSRSFSFIDSGT